MIDIKFYKESPDAITPTVAYNGTSACFDVYATETVIFSSLEPQLVPNGLRIIVPKGYYMRLNTRSSMGFLKNFLVYPGIIDASYTGNFDIKVYHLNPNMISCIKKGEKYAQVEVLKMQEYLLTEVDKEEFEKLQSHMEMEGLRGATKCWGSTNNDNEL